MTAPPQVNGHTRPAAALPVIGDWRPVQISGNATVWEKPTPVQEQPEVPPAPQPELAPTEPALDHEALAKAEAIRIAAAADAEAKRIQAEADAAAVVAKAEAEAEKQRIANERAVMKLDADRAANDKRIADLEAQRAAAEAAAARTRKEAAAEAQREVDRGKEQQRTENLWKWGARAIYLVGLIIAAPIQFIAFWDEKRPFLVAAPALLEGLALVLAAGAAWAVAHRRDVMPYRVGIMIGALIAGGINMWHGLTDQAIGLNAGLIGTLASLGGPIVLMAYEHGIAQKADGIPSGRELRAARKAKAAEEDARAKAKAEKKAAEDKAAAGKAEQQARALAEQQRRDDDRKAEHEGVWLVANAMRSARGAEFITEQIWGDAWYRVTGSKHVGITAEIEAQTRAAQARMKAATECPADDPKSQVESHYPTRSKKDPNAPDGRRFNGGIPPLRQPGDALPNSDAARKAASLAARQDNTTEEQK
ncbi:hypothetical protein ACWGDX_13210 [Streptomyces sp. NPDC055025]